MRLTVVLAVLLFALPSGARDLPRNTMPKAFVYLREVAPAIVQDIRYATSNNFTGSTLPGYGAGECILRRDAAIALAQVAQDLARQNLGLKTYDCYRPERAVRAMWRWAHDGADDGDKRFYPHEDKLRLFTLGYIAAHSRHSTGTAVDLTLIALPSHAAMVDSHATGGPCTAPAPQRAPDNSLDMGTGFDCLDEKSYTRSSAVTPEQRRAREQLRTVMTAHGFRNYFREWWHYEFMGTREPQLYDFPISSFTPP